VAEHLHCSIASASVIGFIGKFEPDAAQDKLGVRRQRFARFFLRNEPFLLDAPLTAQHLLL
jgi:hypothetical protein